MGTTIDIFPPVTSDITELSIPIKIGFFPADKRLPPTETPEGISSL